MTWCCREKLFKLSDENWGIVDDEIRRGMARMAAASAWGLGEWSTMSEYVQMIPEDSVEGAFYRSVTAVQGDRYPQARQVGRAGPSNTPTVCILHILMADSPPLVAPPPSLKLISMARDVLDTELTALVGESYNRAYGAMVQVQLLSELEEVIEYKMHPERRDMIWRAWWDRLQVRGRAGGRDAVGGVDLKQPGLQVLSQEHAHALEYFLGEAGLCLASYPQGIQDNIEDWERVLRVHSLVLSPKEEVQALCRYASICRKSGRMVRL